MEAKPTLIHIGYHKTGSTLLQKELFNNRTLGFNLIPRKLSLNDIAKPKMYDFDIEDVRAKLNDNWEKGLINVLSEEDFVGSPHTAGFNDYTTFLKLKNLYPDAKILICIREQKSMILSTYKQYIKTVGTLKLHKYLNPPKRGHQIIPNFDKEYFEYHKVIKMYQEGFGKEQVMVIPFELLKESSENYIQKILTFLDYDLSILERNKISTDRKVNPSRPYFTLSAKRIYNLLFTESRLSPNYIFNLPTKIDQPFFTLFSKFELLFGRKLQKRLKGKEANIVKDNVGDFYKKSNQEVMKITGLDLKHFGYDV